MEIYDINDELETFWFFIKICGKFAQNYLIKGFLQ